MISVLYVDDEELLLDLGKIFLEKSGTIEVDLALSADIGLQKLETCRYDAIVSDYQMPGMNGLDFLKEIRNRYGWIPFILFTGRGREEVIIRALNDGVDFYIQKGGDPKAQFAELQHQIRTSVQHYEAVKAKNESRRQLSHIINFLPDATFAINLNREIITWNRAIEELTGIPAYEMIGKKNCEYAIPIYGERRPMLIDLILSPNVEDKRFFSNIHYDGKAVTAESITYCQRQIRYLWGKATPLYDANGIIYGAIESIRDVSDRKYAEEALRKSEEMHRLFLDATNDIFWDFDIPSGSVTFSPKLCKTLGYGPEEFPKTFEGWAELIHPDDKKMVTAELDRQLTTVMGESGVSYRLKGKDGEWHWVYSRGKFVGFDNRGKGTRIVGTTTDMTPLKKTQLALQEKDATFRKMIETLPIAIAITSKNSQRAEYINPMFSNLCGYSLDEIPTIDDWWKKVCPDEAYRQTSSEKWNTAVEFALNTQSRSQAMELKITCKDGTMKRLLCQYVPIGEKGYSYALDLSDQKRAPYVPENRICP